MPAIWSSSESPISVREVWVDGIRHAILSPDDPFHDIKNRQRPQTFLSKSKNYSAKYSCRDESFNRPTESLDSCLVKFHVLANRKNAESLAGTKITRRQSAPPISQPLNRSQDQLDFLPSNGLSKVSRNKYDSLDEEKSQSIQSAVYNESPLLSRENSIIKSDATKHYQVTNNIIKTVVQFSDNHDEINTLHEINKNPLSERVLYWMDMSGRVKDYKSKEENAKIISDRRLNIENSRECNFHRRNSAIPSRDLTSIFHYKLCSNQMKHEFISHEVQEEKKEDECIAEKRVRIISEIQPESTVKSEIILERNKSSWSPYGRPQLHIFMPELNSSEEEDTFSQNSSAIEDTS